MPLFAGFATKFILFQAAAQQGLLWLSSIAVFFSFVSLYYYLIVIKEMYLGKPPRPSGAEPTRFPTPWLEYGALTLLIAGVFLIGLYPQPVFDIVEEGAVAMMAASEAPGTVTAPP
jgi:NADH-quinone oxidoreductase subunit N